MSEINLQEAPDAGAGMTPRQKRIQDILVLLVGLLLAGIPIGVGSVELAAHGTSPERLSTRNEVVLSRTASIPGVQRVSNTASSGHHVQAYSPPGGAVLKAAGSVTGSR